MIKGCNIFFGQKLANNYSFVGGRIIVQQETISRAERSGKPSECGSGGDILLPYKILHLLFFPLV